MRLQAHFLPADRRKSGPLSLFPRYSFPEVAQKICPSYVPTWGRSVEIVKTLYRVLQSDPGRPHVQRKEIPA